ncbi:uncharacterized protein M421DRAFT_3011 [Didymella exigua CBS 183.55]|uniref:Uncharacterized protein n=1 Tax=Didymella exigua CBS 183.55 TaxID=1150837 RepID=A0A6A5RTC9_9PLEO|nr:uncharacterized protein M421DRAFT_3011 [Didymella exigua CBS 183.55]KAF1930703.1 hypothetical protein M421DRAFT_3011 [Didymella exigua CBS 183.55]
MSRLYDDYEEDEWYHRDVYNGARHVPKPQIREHLGGRRISEYLNPEVHYTSGLHRTKSTGHSPTPNVTIYNTTRMDNESNPNMRTTTDQRSREASADGRGRTRRMPGEWGLDDEVEELRMQMRLARSRSRGEHYHHHGHSPDRTYDDRLKLSLAEQKLREAEAKIEAERREEIIKRKLELKYIKDRQERDDEEARIKCIEERLRTDLDLKREREERARERALRDEADKRERILADSKAKAEKELREKKAEKDRILADHEREERDADEKRKRLVQEQREKFEKEQRERDAQAKAQEKEAERIVAEAQVKREAAAKKAREAEQAAVDAYNKRKAEEEAKARAEQERIVYEYERKKVLDAEKAKKQREELLLQMELEKKAQAKKEQEEYEDFMRRQAAKKAAEKAKQDKEDAELEAAMRKRLAQFGFQENQIQAMVHPEQQKKLEQQQVGLTPHNPLRIAPQPTYAKIRREYLDIETLHYYDIPYEYDADPSYIIVLREMNQRETDILFEHTRRLRSNHGHHLFIEADGRDRHGKKEYAFVRKKSRSRSRSDISRPAKNVTLCEMLFR